MSMNLFIDSNIFLSFYYLTNEDLDELEKLTALLKRKNLTLYLTEQVRDEFARNRERKIDEAMKKLRKHRFNLEFPHICTGYSEYETLRDGLLECDNAHKTLMDRLEGDIESEELAADKIIAEVFSFARCTNTTPALIDRARVRKEVGNPPGKAKRSLGDEINWEMLLEEVPDSEDLYLITEDADFMSRLNEQRLNPFLASEWEAKKKSVIHFYRRISGFFKSNYPDIKLSGDLEKDLCIRDLADSPNFAMTHVYVAKLKEYGTDFSRVQLNTIVNAVNSNSQVHWIIGDPDVKEFVVQLIEGRESEIDKIPLILLKHHLRHSNGDEAIADADSDDIELPF